MLPVTMNAQLLMGMYCIECITSVFCYYLWCTDIFVMIYVPAFVVNHAEMTHFRPEYVSYMKKSLRQLMNQSKLKYTG